MAAAQPDAQAIPYRGQPTQSIYTLAHEQSVNEAPLPSNGRVKQVVDIVAKLAGIEAWQP
jgi:hypothetical protein